MKSDLISSQALGLTMAQGPRDNQNQELWQQQLEQASLWQTNLTVKAFNSRYDLPKSGGQQDSPKEVSHLQATPLFSVGIKKETVLGVDEQARSMQVNTKSLVLPHIANRHGQVGMDYVAKPLTEHGGTPVVANNESAAFFSPRVKLLFTQIWQKQHVFLSDIDGMKQLWIRDSTTAKGMTGKLATGLLGSMSQLGVELNSVVVNGQLIFTKNHGMKE